MRRVCCVVSLLCVGLTAAPCLGQEAAPDALLQEYVQQRTRAIAEQHLQKNGMKVPTRPPELLTTRSDTIRQRISAMRPGATASSESPSEPDFVVHVSYLASKLERSWYERRFGDVQWAFYGANGREALDTMQTRVLRARLQAQFGRPTQRLTDLDDGELAARDDFPQFEYWFILNGKVPFRVMDTNGPFERGLVVATDRRYRKQLPAMRRAFLGVLVDGEQAGAYYDYYYDDEGSTWYRVQFDGNDYLVEPGRPPALGRQTLIDRLRARPDDAQQ